MNIEAKDFPVFGGDATDEHPHGTFDVVLSAPTLDRDGEIIDTRAFDPLPDHISFDTDHSMSCDSVVGSGTPYYADDGTLRVKGSYCSDVRSQTIRQKVAEGHIRTTSVTFMAATRQKDEKGVEHITAGELLNGTFTPIPSNRESVVLAAKSLLAANLKAGARNSAKDSEMIQGAHDAMASLGATCPTPDDPASRSHRGAEKKAIVGSVEALQERVCDALEDAYGQGGEWWGFLRGVVQSDGGGYCVYQQNGDTYRQDFTDDGSVVTLTGTATEVDIHEIVTPDADADREDDPTLTARSVATAEDAAAKAAAESATAAVVPDEVKAAHAARCNQLNAAFL